MDFSWLVHAIEHYDIPTKAVNTFWKTLLNYKVDSSDEYQAVFKDGDENDFCISVQTISLKLGNWPECNYNHIVVFIPIWYKNKQVGDYQVMFTLNGQIDDDMFRIY